MIIHARCARSSLMARRLVASLGAALFGGCASGDEGEDSGCLGPGGVYQRGKAPYPGANASLVCCEGLLTYYRQRRNGVDGTCVEPVGSVNFSCLEGRCGDGQCEAGEQGACGCEADCGG